MADTPQERKQRHLAHKRGDHTLCDPSRCPDAAGDDIGEIERTVVKLLAELRYEPADPRSVGAAVALKLARSLDRRMTASIAAELRQVLGWLVAAPNAAPDAVDELAAHRFARRVDMMLTTGTTEPAADEQTNGHRRW